MCVYVLKILSILIIKKKKEKKKKKRATSLVKYFRYFEISHVGCQGNNFVYLLIKHALSIDNYVTQIKKNMSFLKHCSI